MSGHEPANLIIRAQDFDSELLGAPVERLLVSGAPKAGDLDGGLKEARERWLQEGVWLVDCRVPEAWTAAQASLERVGFRPVEVLVTFSRPIEPVPSEPGAVPARIDDAAACGEVAGHAFRDDRYHVDPEIPDAGADEVKRVWAHNAVNGRADSVLVVREAGRVVGFVSCLLADDAVVIDLIAVAPGSQGKGLGEVLLQGVRAAYAGRVRDIRASTQEANRASTALYRRLGFEEVARTRTYHWTHAEARP
jgi:ribosomal protein S18 acetylase RimI-like enzyme